MARKAVQFGAGNIGRGFLGQLFYESGYKTTFIDVAQDIIDGLNSRRAYPLRIVGDTIEEQLIQNVSAVRADDVNGVAQAIAEADLVSTAVGVSVLPRIAPALAAGLARRFERTSTPLNIIICENMLHAGPFLREEVRKHLPDEHHDALDKQVGFVEASIGRMVPVMTETQKAEDQLLVCVEPYCELPVDRAGFRGPIPELRHMKALDNFEAYVERKLFVHNMSHATGAYLGYLRGHEFIWQAVADPVVREKIKSALDETCRGLAARHGMNLDDLRAHGADLICRYQNKALADQVARIAHDPIRKLGPNDRLVGAGLMCLEQGIEPIHVAFATAAAIHFDHPADEAARRVQQIRTTQGLDGVLRDVCGIDPETPFARCVKDQAQRLKDEGWLAE